MTETTSPSSREGAAGAPGAPGPKVRKTRPSGEARRAQILDSAAELFAAEGYNAVSVADLAAHVGITQAGLLHHFPTKGAILLAMLQERAMRNFAEEDQQVARSGPYSEAFLSTLARNEERPRLVQLFTLLSAEAISETHPAHEWFAEHYSTLVKRATTGLAAQLDDDKLPPGVDSETVARWIIGLADGLRIQWLLDPGALNRHELVARFVDFLGTFLKFEHPRSEPELLSPANRRESGAVT